MARRTRSSAAEIDGSPLAPPSLAQPSHSQQEAAQTLAELSSRLPTVTSNGSLAPSPAPDDPPSPPNPRAAANGSYVFSMPSLNRNSSSNMVPMTSLIRGGSTGGSTGGSFIRTGEVAAAPVVDWRATVSIEERQEVRKRLRTAYEPFTSSLTLDDMIELVCAVEEEFLHLSAPSRLDYIKQSLQYDRRLVEKRRQLAGDVAVLGAAASSNGAAQQTEDQGGDEGKPVDAQAGAGEEGRGSSKRAKKGEKK